MTDYKKLVAELKDGVSGKGPIPGDRLYLKATAAITELEGTLLVVSEDRDQALVEVHIAEGDVERALQRAEAAEAKLDAAETALREIRLRLVVDADTWEGVHSRIIIAMVEQADEIAEAYFAGETT